MIEKEVFLPKPKTALGKFVSGAWKKLKEWRDEKHHLEVENEVHKSVRSKFEALKKI
ncbi:MAG: hypothetical protein UFG06_14520 [Lachnospiraceae bacterium]|nr:hypothetical protein [Lachnospiraceae bacterium]